MAQILIVDDESGIRRLMRAVLNAEGHIVSEAADGHEALAAVELSMPDVILLDLMMPRMDGWRFLEELRARSLRSQTRVIIVSALADEETRSRGTVAGAHRHIAKPFDVEALVQAVDEALAEQPEALCERRERLDDLASLIRTIDALTE